MITNSRDNDITIYDLERATEEGYLRIGLTNQYDNKLTKIAELTNMFCP